MPRFAPAAAVACAAAAMLAAAPAATAAPPAPPWSLHQLAPPYECISEISGECVQSSGRALYGARALAISRDGRFVYETADNGDAVGVFLRDRGTGRLLEVSCVSSVSAQECSTVDDGLDDPEGIAISPDGRAVYVASFTSSSVNAYTRDPASGALTRQNCFSNATGGDPACTNTAVGLRGARGVAVVGNHVYVTGAENAAVTTFLRNTTTGALISETGCETSGTATPGCTSTGVYGMDQAGGVVPSPDGRQLYVAGSNSSAVVTFNRASDGTLSFARCVSELHGSLGDPNCGSHAAAGIVDPQQIAISASGRSVYVSGGLADAVAHFERTTTTGALTFKNCVAEPRTTPFAEHGCGQAGKGLHDAEGVAVTADGRSVYVASPDSDAVAVFERSLTSGNLRQLPGAYDCLTTLAGSSSDPGCGGHAKGLKSAIGVAAPSDGRNVYVTGFGSDALASFARTPPPRFAGVAIKTRSATVHKRVAPIRLGCPKLSRGCSGHVALRTGGRSIGSAAFVLAAGARRTVDVVLTHSAWSKLKDAGTLHASARAVAHDGFGQTTVTARKTTLHSP